jgi:hypothetical protein
MLERVFQKREFQFIQIWYRLHRTVSQILCLYCFVFIHGKLEKKLNFQTLVIRSSGKCKVKVKLSLCLMKYHGMTSCWETTSIAPCILNLSTKLRMSRAIHPLPQYVFMAWC